MNIKKIMKAGKQGMFGSLKRELGSYIDISKVKTSSIYKILSRKAPCTRKITSLIFLLSLICGSLQVQAQIKGGIIPLVTQPTNPPDMPGPVTGPTPITPGTTTSTYTVTSASGASGYTWTLSNGSAGTITNVGNTATVHWSVSFSGYTIINCTAFNILGSTAANGLAVQVLAAPTASISPVALSTNYNTSPGTISVTNPVDVVNYTYQWQSSPNNSIWTSISGATATSYTPGNLTTTIYFRAVLTNISDLVSYSNSATVTVYPQLVSGNTSPASQSINYNTTPTALTATAATGGNGTCTYQWQSSPNNSTWTNVSGATALAYTPGVLTTTTYYHLVSTSNSASVNSSSATVTVYPLLVSGNISPVLQSINYNTGPTTLIATAATGGNGTYTYQWQNSPNGTTWTNITGATLLTYAPLVLITSTYYHLVSTSNGVSVTGSTATVTVYPQLVSGTVSPASQSVNYNVTASLSSAAATGGNSTYTYQWQSSPNNATWTNISGATALSYTTLTLTSTTYYRMVSTSNGASVNSNSIPVTVYPQLVSGTVSGNQNINYGGTPTGITSAAPTGGNGTYTYQWQSSPNNSTWTNVSGATALAYTPAVLTATTYYHLVSTSNGVSVTGSAATATVYPQLVPGTTTPTGQTTNYNTVPATLSSAAVTGGSGTYVYQWQSSPDGTNFINISGAATLTYTPPTLTATTYYRLLTNSNGINVNSNTVTVTVYPQLVSANNTTGYQAIKNTTLPAPLTAIAATGGNGTITYQWQNSPTIGGDANWTNIPGATNLTYTFTSTLTATMNYQLATTSNGLTVNSNINTITVSSLGAAPSNPSADLNLNWVMTRSYDENGNEIAASKAFFDNNGKSTQTQIKNETANQVLASQTIYDLQGRPVVTTLAAPTNNSAFAYKSNFVTAGGVAYGYLNFDGDPTNTSNPYLKLSSPDLVDATTIGSLGWYYSNNNSDEQMVATTSYPYSRGDFYHDGTGATKRAAGIGESLKMGTGHETTSNSFPVQNELNNYLAIRNKLFSTATVGATPGSMIGQALGSVSMDQNGTSVLSVTDLSGKMSLMTGRADATSGAWLPVTSTLSLSDIQGQYSFNINTDNGVRPTGGSSGSSLPNNITNFTISSPNIVIVTCTTCDVQVTYTGPGNGFVFPIPGGSGIGYNYSIASAYPFTVSATAFFIPLIAPLTIYDQAEAQYAEPSGTSIQYFQLATPSVVNLTGAYTLYNMTTETAITTFTTGSQLPVGYYKVTATAPTIANATNNVTVSYSNAYSDISYNYYNQLGQLIASIAPNGVQLLLKNGIANYTSPPFLTTYQYDLRGRLISTTSPDGGTSNFIYRQDGKIRFSQNAYQKNATNAGTGNAERFSYTNYDSYGRSIESGEYVVPGAMVVFAGLSTDTTMLKATDAAGNVPGCTKLTNINSYYDLPDINLTLASYVQDAGFLKGALSYTTKANLSNIISTTWYNYDDHGRVSWMVKNMAGAGLTGYKTVDYTYNQQGNVTAVDYQKGTVERFTHYYNYDEDGRLINVQTSANGLAPVQQANYYYYLHGPLKRTELGNQLQGLDYVYTPQGWLKAVNSPTGVATNDPGKDGATGSPFAQDAFGMQLEYFPGDYNRLGSNITDVATKTQNYYDGNVAGMSWQSNTTVTPNPPTMYTYNYDAKYQYTGSTWGTPAYTSNPGTFTTSSIGKFQEKNIQYDPNGNITALQRTGVNGGALTDNFSYNYTTNTNQLASVANAGTSTLAAPYGTYAYDEIGRLKTQVASNVVSNVVTSVPTYLQYDVTGKITGIYSLPTMTTASLVESYIYDESGNRITTTNSSGTTYYVYDASGNALAIYNGATPAIAEVPIYGSGRLGTYFTTGSLYRYEIRDNVGSVRVVVMSTKNTTTGQANIYKYTDYYPFGSIAQSGGTGYRYDYQGAYAEKDPVTGFNNFELRMYDGKIGRWLSVDPKGQFASPYTGMGNNPVTGIDKDGGFEEKPDGTPLYDAGDWHVSDRLANNDLWKSANLYNLNNGNSDQYQTITQRTDFYGWFQNATQTKGFETVWPGVANIVAGQMSKLDNPVVAWWVGDDVVKFGNAGNTAIFNDVFDNLDNLYNGPVLKGSAAAAWDAKALHHEQFDVVQPIYARQSAETIKILTNMATGSYLYGLGVTGPLRFQGDLMNPQDRYNHGATKVVDFFKLQQVYIKVGW